MNIVIVVVIITINIIIIVIIIVDIVIPCQEDLRQFEVLFFRCGKSIFA